MSTYSVMIGKKEYQVEINENQFKINGEVVHADLIALHERGFYLLRCGAFQRELHVQYMGKSQYALDANGRHVMAEVARNNVYRHSRINPTSSGDIVTPMPGVVVKVNVGENDIVHFGQVLVVLESMKMQMEMHAPCSGRVTLMNAKTGVQMSKGDLLLRISPG